MLQWEVVNEYHDWANIHNHTPEQITEIVRLACDTTKEVNPKRRADSEQLLSLGENTSHAAGWPGWRRRGRLRTVRKYLQDLVEAGVEFDVVGIQIYFPQRDLSDIARLVERLSVFGKPIYITEIGASSNLVAPRILPARRTRDGDEPYAWHRHWDEELQADWLEQVYTLWYSKPSNQGDQLVRLLGLPAVHRQRRRRARGLQSEEVVFPCARVAGVVEQAA